MHIQLMAVELLVVEVGDSALSCLAAVVGVTLFVKADEGEGTLLAVLLALLVHENEALDVAIAAE